MGDDAAAQIEDKFLEPVRQAADALSQLQATILQTVENLKNADDAGVGSGGDPMGGGDLGADPMGGGGLGSPEDAMGGDPMGGDDLGGDPLGGDELAGDLADASLDGGDGERPMKDM